MNDIGRNVEIELLASTLRQRMAFSMNERLARMQEVLEAIETRDISPSQIREVTRELSATR